MTAQGRKIFLSKGAYINRKRVKQECDTFINFGTTSRETTGKKIIDNISVERQDEINSRLKAVCGSLEAKSLQYMFFMQKNELVNNCPIELSKCQ
jgi:hypothetical protein